MADQDDAREAIRRLMFGIAYRMLGSVADAEDVVQDSFVRIEEARRDGVEIASDRAYAATVATRMSIDLLRSARRRRESYVGTWLPEPLVEDADPAIRVEQDDTLTMAFMTLLERLKPVDRAVLVLREAFGFGYDEIAAIVGKSEAACRQIFSRAGRALRSDRRRPAAPTRGAARLAERLVAALRAGDVESVASLLSVDVVFSADGGGKAPAISAPLAGRTAVARFLLGIARQAERAGVRMEPTSANAAGALRLVGPDDRVLGVLVVEGHDEIAAMYNQINPDKLHHLGEVGDGWVLLRGER